MGTNTKEVPSKVEAVSIASFLMGALYISGLTLGVMFALWKFKIGVDFRHVVRYSVSVIVLARLGVWITAHESDPASIALVVGVFHVCLTASNLDAQIPIIDIVLSMLAINMIVANVRKTSLALRYAFSVLIVQYLMLGAGLYVLYHKF